MVSHMSCFQLSDEFLFAGLHLSCSISPPLRLFPRFSSCLRRFPGDEARLVEQIIYSCLSPDSALYRREMRDGKKKRRERGGHAAVFLSCNAGDRSKWMTAPASKGASAHWTCSNTQNTHLRPSCASVESKFLSSEAQETRCLNLLHVLIGCFAARRLIHSHKLSAELFSA